MAYKNSKFKRSKGKKKYGSRKPKCVVIVKKYYGRKRR